MEIISSVKINSLTERQFSRLSILPPQTIPFPGVRVTVNVKSRYEDPVKVIYNAIDVRVRLPVAFDQGVCQVAHSGDANPFTSMSGASDNDSHFLVLSRAFGPYFQGVDLTAFITLADGGNFHEAGKKGFKEPHPWEYYSGGLIALEEEIICPHFGGLHVCCSI